MEQSPAAMWACLLGAGLVLVLAPSVSVTTHPKPPELVSCVFQERANITCQWKPGDPQMTNYTLSIRKMAGAKVFTCPPTSDTKCTVTIGDSTVRSDFCINITAHGRDGNVTSGPRCQSGRIEIKLEQVKLEDVRPVAADPRCLSVSWRRKLNFAVSPNEIKDGILKSQIAFKAEGQCDFQVENVTVRDFNFTVCLFRADTTYTLKLRHRYNSSRSPWSLWSSTAQGRTAEDAPSSALLFWRRVKETDQNGRRLTSLLWKPLPHFLANGLFRFYNVTCRTEGGLVLTDNGSCRNLHGSCTSCSLHLPPGRCSCSLTASTSAGTSPEAWIWLHGAQDAELPSMSQITAVPLDDHHLEVRWIAPAEPSPSGFVVEWFTVREKNDSTIHWERLNRSCTTLVISGVEPLTRYTVSVRALYAEGGAGQDSTQLIYTRQGVPSAGPQVKVQKISGSSVEFSWAPIPVEDLHGFICNYTIYYAMTNQPARSEIVPGHVRRHTLLNLSPGHYSVYLRANTEAGAGENGTTVNVHIGSEEVPVAMYVICLLVLTSGALLLMAGLAHSHIVKHKLCQNIPDPSNSSLSRWTLKPALESMKWAATPEKCEIKYSEVVLLNESELHNSELDQDLHYKTSCHLQTYSSHQCALQPGSESVDSHHKTRSSDMESMRTSTGADGSLGAGFSSCPSIYMNILYSQALPLSLLPLSYTDGHYGSVHVHDGELQPGGAGEQPGSPQTTSRGPSPPPSQTDGLGTHRHLHGTLSFSGLCGVSHPSPFLSHLANAASQHLCAQKRCSSAQQLEPDTFSQSTNPPRTFTPFTQAVFLDFSHSAVECDPYIPV
ncbi:interleukin-31 receptor subunit alpha isoform X2 [Sphaeramia orbicularis]|uniref:interleukin-31 receptor subunit alpha isoform X2 n=1 Tax=Sphaeramia orbicularis TaxID=375764 RepID=UPI0011806D9D|nr:interleukin-31 receptor subunit alpha-like isoform X2 [Sphaeramia orbicularis]